MTLLQVSSLTNLVVGVTAPVKRCQIFQLHSWQGWIQFYSKDLSRRNISECSDSMVKGKFWAATLLKTNFPFHNTIFLFPKDTFLPIAGATLPASLARLLQAARSHRDSANPESPVVVVSTNGNSMFAIMITFTGWKSSRNDFYHHHSQHHLHHHHDDSGAERAGVYCAVSHSWDQLLRQGQVIED